MNDLKALTSQLRAGRISRRGFILGAICLGATVANATVIANRAVASTPKRGGVLRMGLGSGSSTDSLDPSLITTNFMQNLGFGCLRNTLTEIAADGSLVPDLAESWETSDGADWRFKLRRGVEFHNGKTLSPADVVASINYHRGNTKSPVKALLEQIDTISIDGNDVVFLLASPNIDFPVLLAEQKLGIVPEMDGKADALSGIGTGPYRLENFEPGIRAKVTRFENYFRHDGAWFDGVELLAIQDTTARTTALLTGTIDVMDRCELKTVDLLKRTGKFDVLAVEGGLHYALPMNVTTPPFDNVNVRRALKHAIDRDELVERILFGYGSVGNDQPIGSSYRYYASDLPQHAYDPDKANFYLQKAGLKSLNVQLYASDAAFPDALDASALYAERASAANIRISIIRAPNDGYYSNIWMKKPFCATYWAGRPTADLMFSLAYTSDAKWNDTFWNNQRFDALLLSARGERDESKRGDMYREMQQMVSSDGGALIPMFADFVCAHSVKLAHPETVGSNLDMDGARLVQRWWFA